MLLEGLFLPLTTPYLPDGRLNLPKLRENVARCSKTPAAGLVALSHLGQPSLLSDAETFDVLRCVAEAAVAEKVLVAGIARDSVIHALELIEIAAKSGYDVVLVPLPSVLRGQPLHKEAINYFETLADQAALPILLYSGSGEDSIAFEVAAQAAKHMNVIGMVDVEADAGGIARLLSETSNVRRNVTVTSVFAAVTRRMIAKQRPLAASLLSTQSLSGGGTAVAVSPSVSSTLKTRTKAVGFQILSSRTAGILDALAVGAAGAMPPLSASAPQACYEVLAAWKDADPALAAEKQERVRVAAQVVEEGLGVAGIKYAGDLNGYFGGRPRLPGLPLSSEDRQRVEVAMSDLRN